MQLCFAIPRPAPHPAHSSSFVAGGAGSERSAMSSSTPSARSRAVRRLPLLYLSSSCCRCMHHVSGSSSFFAFRDRPAAAVLWTRPDEPPSSDPAAPSPGTPSGSSASSPAKPPRNGRPGSRGRHVRPASAAASPRRDQPTGPHGAPAVGILRRPGSAPANRTPPRPSAGRGRLGSASARVHAAAAEVPPAASNCSEKHHSSCC